MGAYSVHTDVYGLPPRDGPRPPNPTAVLGRMAAREVMERNPPGYPTDNRYELARQGSLGLPWLCVNLIREGIGSSSVRVSQKRRPRMSPGGQQFKSRKLSPVRKAMPTPHSEAEDSEYVPAPDAHPLCRLFRHVNKVDMLSDFLGDWVVNEELFGEAVLWPIKGRGTDYPVELWVIPTALTFPQQGISPQYPCGSLRVQNWYPNAAGSLGLVSGSFELDNEEVLRPLKRHPLYRFTGYSPLTAGARELDQWHSISESRKNSMDHGLSPAALITLPGATQTQVDDVYAQMNAKYTGSKGRPVLVWAGADGQGKGGAIDILTQPGARDMDFPSGWEQMVKFTSALWQTTAGVLGLTEADSYAAFYARLKQHHTMCLLPKATRMGKYLTKHLAERYWPGDRLCVEIDLPKIDDAEMQQKWAALKLGNLYTLNEARGLMNLPPVDGGDVPADVYVAKMQGEVSQQQQKQGIAAGVLPDPNKVPEAAPGAPVAGGSAVGGDGGPPPRPGNPDGKGSLPPRVKSRRKAAKRFASRVLKSLGG